MPVRCCMPPESWLGRWFSKPASPTSFSSSIARCRACARGRLSNSAGSMTFFSAVRHGRSWAAWKTMPTSRRGPVMGVPFINATPEVGSISPAMMRSRVVLPQPLGPTTVMNSPSAMRRSIGARAVIGSPFEFQKTLLSWRSSMAA